MKAKIIIHLHTYQMHMHTFLKNAIFRKETLYDSLHNYIPNGIIVCVKYQTIPVYNRHLVDTYIHVLLEPSYLFQWNTCCELQALILFNSCYSNKINSSNIYLWHPATILWWIKCKHFTINWIKLIFSQQSCSQILQSEGD